MTIKNLLMAAAATTLLAGAAIPATAATPAPTPKTAAPNPATGNPQAAPPGAILNEWSHSILKTPSGWVMNSGNTTLQFTLENGTVDGMTLNVWVDGRLIVTPLRRDDFSKDVPIGNIAAGPHTLAWQTSEAGIAGPKTTINVRTIEAPKFLRVDTPPAPAPRAEVAIYVEATATAAFVVLSGGRGDDLASARLVNGKATLRFPYYPQEPYIILVRSAEGLSGEARMLTLKPAAPKPSNPPTEQPTPSQRPLADTGERR